MAFCPNCGTKLPDGAVFCGECGTRLPGAATAAARPVKSKKPLILGAVAAVLVVGLIIGVLFLTGVLGKKGPVGTWELETPFNSDGDTVRLVLEKGGTGYQKEITYYPSSGRVDEEYAPLTWTEGSITLIEDLDDRDIAPYVLDGDKLILTVYGRSYTFVRCPQEDPYTNADTAKPGVYQLTALYEDGEDISWRIADRYGTMELTVYEGGTPYGYASKNGSSALFTYDRHFFYEDGEPQFYVYKDGTITVFDYDERLVLTRVR